MKRITLVLKVRDENISPILRALDTLVASVMCEKFEVKEWNDNDVEGSPEPLKVNDWRKADAKKKRV